MYLKWTWMICALFACNVAALGAVAQQTDTKTAASVFALRVLSAQDPASVRQIDLRSKSGIKLLQSVFADSGALRRLSKKSNQDRFDQALIAAQIKNCQQKHVSICEVWTETSRGTGFVSGSGNLLWTNAHVLEPHFETLARTEDKDFTGAVELDRPVRVFIFSDEGELVINPFEQSVEIFYRPEQIELDLKTESHFTAENDVIGLKIDAHLAQPLLISGDFLSSTGTDSFLMVSYPQCQNCEARAPVGLQTPMQVSQGTINAVETKLSTLILSGQLESGPGSSGAPWINSQGEVIAIHRGSYESDSGTREVQGIRPAVFSLLSKYH